MDPATIGLITTGVMSFAKVLKEYRPIINDLLADSEQRKANKAANKMATPSDIAKQLVTQGDTVERLLPCVKTAVIVSGVTVDSFEQLRREVWSILSSRYTTSVPQNYPNDICLGVHFGTEWFEERDSYEYSKIAGSTTRTFVGLFSFDILEVAPKAVAFINSFHSESLVVTLKEDNKGNKSFVFNSGLNYDAVELSSIEEAQFQFKMPHSVMSSALLTLIMSENSFEYQRRCKNFVKVVTVYSDDIDIAVDSVSQYNNLALTIDTVAFGDAYNHTIVYDKYAGLLYFYTGRDLQAVGTIDQVRACALSADSLMSTWCINSKTVNDILS